MYKRQAAGREDAQKLKLKVGSPLQEVRTITYDDNNRVIEYSISRDSGDISTYKIKLKYRGCLLYTSSKHIRI